MRVIIGTVFNVGIFGVFVAVTAARFIAEHMFATTALASVVAAVIILARRTNRRGPRARFPAHQPPHYPAILAPARPASGGPPQWAEHGMSSAALPSRARRSIAPRRSHP